MPIVLGGDHSIPIPVLQVLSGKLNGKLGIVVFDSQFDMSYEPKYLAGSQWACAFDLGVVEPENFVQIGLHGGRERLADKAVAEELGYRYYTMTDIDELRHRHGRPGTAARRPRPAPRRSTSLVDELGCGSTWSTAGREPTSSRAACFGLSSRSACPAGAGGAGWNWPASTSAASRRATTCKRGHLSQLAARAALEVIAGIALQRP